MPVAASTTVLRAVETLYGSIGAGLPQLWLDEAPEGSSYPRAILNHEGETPVVQSYGGNDGPGDVQTPTEAHAKWTIHLLAENDSDQAEAMALSVMQTFTPQAIQLTFDPKACMWRTNYTVTSRLQRTAGAKPIYDAAVSYDCELSPNY